MKIELLDITSDATNLIEKIGRICYNSKPGENYVPGTMVKNLIKRGHTSVLEHAKATFHISEVSRALTHQLVRHRLASYTQRSQRYCKEDEFGYVIPPCIAAHKYALDKYDEIMKNLSDNYSELVKMGMKPEDARFILPNACNTEITVTANFREWRSIFALRCESHAQWEIRNLCTEILRILYSKEPSVFEDQYYEFCREEVGTNG